MPQCYGPPSLVGSSWLAGEAMAYWIQVMVPLGLISRCLSVHDGESGCMDSDGQKLTIQGTAIVAGQQRRRARRISPRIAGIFGCLVAAILGYGAVSVIDQGHAAIGRQWRTAVVIGGGASVGLLALIAAVLAVGRWRRQSSRVLFPVGIGLVWALMLITWAGVHVAGDAGPVSNPWQVGLAASFVPMALLAMVVIPLLTWRRQSPDGAGAAPGRRAISVIVEARRDGWRVTWVGMGQLPRVLQAPTLTSAADAADRDLAGLAAHQQGTVEARMVIYPERSRGGPTFDVAGEPGGLTATSAGYPGLLLTGVTLEDLTGAVQQAIAGSSRGFRLRWTKAMKPASYPEPSDGRE